MPQRNRSYNQLLSTDDLENEKDCYGHARGSRVNATKMTLSSAASAIAGRKNSCPYPLHPCAKSGQSKEVEEITETETETETTAFDSSAQLLEDSYSASSSSSSHESSYVSASSGSSEEEEDFDDEYDDDDDSDDDANSFFVMESVCTEPMHLSFSTLGDRLDGSSSSSGGSMNLDELMASGLLEMPAGAQMKQGAQGPAAAAAAVANRDPAAATGVAAAPAAAAALPKKKSSSTPNLASIQNSSDHHPSRREARRNGRRHSRGNSLPSLMPMMPKALLQRMKSCTKVYMQDPTPTNSSNNSLASGKGLDMSISQVSQFKDARHSSPPKLIRTKSKRSSLLHTETDETAGRLNASMNDLSMAAALEDASETEVETPPDVLEEILMGVSISKLEEDEKHYFLPVTEERMEAYDAQLVAAMRAQDLTALQELFDCHKNDDKACLGNIQTDCDWNACNKQGESLVHLACRRHSNLAILEFLVEQKGASVRVRDDWGKTPLHELCWNGQPAFDSQLFLCVKLVLARAPELLWTKDKRGFTPLDYVRPDAYGEWNAFLRCHRLFLRSTVQLASYRVSRIQLEQTMEQAQQLLVLNLAAQKNLQTRTAAMTA